MNILEDFEKWKLESPLDLEIQNKDNFQKNKQNKDAILIEIFHESEVENDSSSTFLLAKNFYGKLKPKNIYPFNNIYSSGTTDVGKFFILFSSENQKSIFTGDESIGTAHLCSTYGADLSIIFQNFLAKKNKENIYYVTLSETLKKEIGNDQRDFFLGLYQRSVNTKKKTQGNKTKIIFEEGFWTSEHIYQSKIMHEAMLCTRSLIHFPSNILNPSTYEKYLREMMKKLTHYVKSPQSIHMEVLSYEKLLEEKCGLINAVGNGSKDKPCILKLVYKPHQEKVEKNKTAKNSSKKNGPKKHIVLVGKGITFDSGGYDIKPSSGMRIMKKDMGGSAACVGVFFACSALNLDLQLTCYLAIAENMISENAMRPGDVYLSRSGYSVEIENTDAEGRLVLADALSFAADDNPDFILDIATLTGAARISLGSAVDSFFSNDEKLAEVFLKSSQHTGDWIWRVPLVQEYENYFESSLADFSNASASSFGGSITAALFLKKFVKNVPWLHIDSWMWTDKARGLWNEPSSPTAKCVRLVTHALESLQS